MSKCLARHQLAEILPIFVARVLKKWQCSQAGADQGKFFFGYVGNAKLTQLSSLVTFFVVMMARVISRAPSLWTT